MGRIGSSKKTLPIWRSRSNPSIPQLYPKKWGQKVDWYGKRELMTRCIEMKKCDRFAWMHWFPLLNHQSFFLQIGKMSKPSQKDHHHGTRTYNNNYASTKAGFYFGKSPDTMPDRDPRSDEMMKKRWWRRRISLCKDPNKREREREIERERERERDLKQTDFKQTDRQEFAARHRRVVICNLYPVHAAVQMRTDRLNR